MSLVNGLPVDVLMLVSEWLNTADILAFKNASQTLRAFVQEYLNTLLVSRVDIIYKHSVDPITLIPACDAWLRVFLSVGQRPGDQRGGLKVVGMNEHALSFWKFTWTKSAYLNCNCHATSFYRNNTFMLQSVSTVVDFASLPPGIPHPPLIRIKNCLVKQLIDINSTSVFINCPRVTRPITFGDQVQHVKVNAPLGFRTAMSRSTMAFEFQNPASLKTLKLNVHSFLVPNCSSWGLGNLIQCSNLYEITLKMYDVYSNVPEWATAFNRALSCSLNSDRLQRVNLQGFVNIIDHNGAWWYRVLGLSAQVTRSRSLAESIHLCFRGGDSLQLSTYTLIENQRRKKLGEMALQFVRANRLKTLEFVLHLTTSSESPSPTFHSCNMLALLVMKVFSTFRCSKLSHLYVYQPSAGSVSSEMVMALTGGGASTAATAGTESDFLEEIDGLSGFSDTSCVQQVVHLFPKVVTNPQGVKFVNTDLPLPVSVVCEIVEAIAQNPNFGGFTMVNCKQKLSYVWYKEFVEGTDGRTSKALSEAEFKRIVGSKLLFCG